MCFGQGCFDQRNQQSVLAQDLTVTELISKLKFTLFALGSPVTKKVLMRQFYSNRSTMDPNGVLIW